MRYLGNKDSLTNQIIETLKEKNIYKNGYVFFDAFSGTGSVSNSLKDIYKIIINDNLYSSYVYSLGRINASLCKFDKLGLDPFVFFNANENQIAGFISKNYAPKLSGRTYFSDFNAGRIDYFRTQIEEWKNKSMLDENEYDYLIGCLLESVSKVANVAGVYGACLKTWDPRATKKIVFIPIDENTEKTIDAAEGYNKDIREIISDIDCDILYLDPPYTKNKYTTQYHLLETIARYDNPVVKGITGGRSMSDVSTSWSTKNKVEIEFDYVLANTKAKYILMSYSSDGLMSKEYITAALKRYGVENTFSFKEIKYKKYINTRTKEKGNHFEYLFFIEKKQNSNVRYTCPINYMGGKTQIVDEILKHIGKTDQFVDLMAGGFNVGINVECDSIIYNDINYMVENLVKMFKDYDTYKILSTIEKTISKYKLQKADKDAFIKYRADWNENLSKTKDSYLYLYILLLFGYQQQLRFNSKYEFNNTVGESGYNDPTKEKIVSFSRRIKTMNVKFESLDFEKIAGEIQSTNSTIYIDPPYLITLGSYNDGKRGFNGWNESEEKRLYKFLDTLLAKGTKIVLSNVIEHKGKTNSILKEWVEKNHLTTYSLSAKGRNEVIIINE